MTVQELINELDKIKDKDMTVCIEDGYGYDEVMHVGELNFLGQTFLLISS